MSVAIRFGDPSPEKGTPLNAAIRAAVRRCLADEIDRLLDMVNALDGDPDLEETADEEPDAGDGPELDAGDEGELDDDREPFLGFPIAGTVRDVYPREERFEMFRRFRDEFDFDGEPA